LYENKTAYNLEDYFNYYIYKSIHCNFTG